jgi:hypothetical protein
MVNKAVERRGYDLVKRIESLPKSHLSQELAGAEQAALI